MRMRGRAAVVLVAIGVLAGLAFLPGNTAERDPRWNFIVIVTDDQSFDSIPREPAVMPYLQARILDPNDHWVVFQNGFINTPLCCPARATMLTGRYYQHHRVATNDDAILLDESSTLAVWLDDAGYHTGLVGKYLNKYPFGREPFIPRGWDRWWGKVQGSADSLYRNFTLIEQGIPVRYGDGPGDYSTDVYARKAVEFIRSAPSDRPFFLWFAPNAPHPPWVSPPRHEGRYADLVVPTPPSVGEPDVTDKPAWVQTLPAFDAAELDRMRGFRRASFEALLAVDDAVRVMMDALEDRGDLDRTIIVFVSDNGFAFGEHRWIKKTCPYEGCTRVPFLVRFPGVEHHVEPALVSAVDLAPTIAELAGVSASNLMDGMSLVPLLRDGSTAGRPEGVLLGWIGDERIPGWDEIRTEDLAYIELATGERELYALRTDPYQLVNLAADPRFATQVATLSVKLAFLRGS